MGGVANLILKGSHCQYCGQYLGAATGSPRTCTDCACTEYKRAKKLPCPVCNKKVKAVGLSDHIRAKHEEWI